jgi:hypothetical protein
VQADFSEIREMWMSLEHDWHHIEKIRVSEGHRRDERWSGYTLRGITKKPGCHRQPGWNSFIHQLH